MYWREYAEWALANLPAPVALIRARVKHNGHLPPAWEGRWARVLELCGALVDDNQAPDEVRRLAGVVLGGVISIPELHVCGVCDWRASVRCNAQPSSCITRVSTQYR